jgi:hypothetical protein
MKSKKKPKLGPVLSAHTFRGNSLVLLDTFSSYQKIADSDDDVLPVKSVVTAKEFLDTKGRLRTLRTTKSKQIQTLLWSSSLTLCFNLGRSAANNSGSSKSR